MASDNNLRKFSADLTINKLESLLQEMLNVSNLIRTDKKLRLGSGRVMLYGRAFKIFLSFDSNHQLALEYPTDSIYSAYKIIRDYFNNQP